MKVYIVRVERSDWEGSSILEEYAFSNPEAADACEIFLKNTRSSDEIDVYKEAIDVQDCFPNNTFHAEPVLFSVEGYIDPILFLDGDDYIDADDLEFWRHGELPEKCEISKEDGYDSVEYDMVIKAPTRKEATEKANNNIKEWLKGDYKESVD